MGRTDSLFQLVKSLSRADKRNFKLLTQITSGDKKYLRLFELIERSVEYEETKLLEIFEGKNAASQLSVAKHYLQAIILKSLAYFYRHEGGDDGGMLLQIRILAERNLHGQAHKVLRKAKAEAESRENFANLLELLALERRILVEGNDHKDVRAVLEPLVGAELQAMEAQQNLLSYQHLMDQATLLVGDNQQARTEEQLLAFGEVLGEAPMQHPSQAISRRARILFHSILRQYAYFRMNWKGMLLHSGEVVALFEANPLLREISEMDYLQALYAHGVAQFEMGLEAEAVQSLVLLQAWRPHSPKAAAILYERVYLLALNQSLATGDLEEGLRWVDKLQGSLEGMRTQLGVSALMRLLFAAGRVCFAADKTSEALRWINLFLNEPRSEQCSDLQCFARLLNLMIHVRLGNFDLVEHDLVSTYRFIFKRGRMFRIERMVLRVVKALAGTAEADEKRRVLEAFGAEMGETCTAQLDAPAQEALMLRVWCSSQLGGSSMEEVLKQAYGAKKTAQGTFPG